MGRRRTDDTAAHRRAVSLMAAVVVVLSVGVIVLSLGAHGRQSQINADRKAAKAAAAQDASTQAQLDEMRREVGVLSQQIRDAGLKVSPLATPPQSITVHVVPGPGPTSTTVYVPPSTTATTRPAPSPTTTTTTAPRRRPAPCTTPTVPLIGACP